MKISISPLQQEEVPEFTRIELEAFRSHPRIPMLWRRGYTDDVYEFYNANKTKSFQDDECGFTKAVDATTGETVAVSEWTFALDPAKQAAKEPVDPNGTPPEHWPLEGNWELRRFFDLNLEKWTKQYLNGRAYISMMRSSQTLRAC